MRRSQSFCPGVDRIHDYKLLGAQTLLSINSNSVTQSPLPEAQGVGFGLLFTAERTADADRSKPENCVLC